MKVLRYVFLMLVWFGVGCASTVIPVTQVYPFGPDSYTTSASSRLCPSEVRERVIATASEFCQLRGERSLPVEINLLTIPPETHAVTIVFRCYNPDEGSLGLPRTEGV